MAGKHGSRRHSTTSFSENVVVSEVLSFWDRERVYSSFTFLVKNDKMKLSGESIFCKYAKKNVCKGLYYHDGSHHLLYTFPSCLKSCLTVKGKY